MILCSIRKIFASCISVVVTSFFALTSLRAGIHYWDAGTVSIGLPGNGLSEGGPGSWSTSLANWDNGSVHLAWPTTGVDNDAFFGGTGGLVNVSSPVAANELIFNSTGYSLVGSSRITLNGSSPTINVGENFSASINAGLSGNAGLIKAGLGTLTFTNPLPGAANNNYTMGTTINAGTLAVVADANFGTAPSSAATNITINGGTLQINTGFSLSMNRQLSLGTNNATIAMNSTLDFKVQGLITGGLAGSLTVLGNGFAGSYIPTASNTYAGGTYLGVGSITTPSVNSVGVGGAVMSGAFGTGTLYFDGGKIRTAATAYTIGNSVMLAADTTFLPGSNSLTFAGPVSLLGNRTITAQNSGNIILSGVISNGAAASSFILGAKSAATSTFVFTAANAYTGATQIEGGTLRLGGTNGSISTTNRVQISSGTLINGDALTINNAGKVNRVNPSLALELGGAAGGTLTMVGGSTGLGAQQQSFASLSVGRGMNSLNSSSTSAGSEANLIFTAVSNNFQHTVGGILNYTSATGFTPSFLALPSGTGVSGGVLVGAIRDGVDFIDASSMAFAPVAYTNDQWSANTQTNITENNVVPFTGSTGSLRFNSAVNTTVTLSGTNIIQSGNILVSENVGSANASVISGGTISSGNGTDLIVVHNNGDAIGNSSTNFPSALTIQSSIVDQSSSPIGFTKAGTGVVILGGSSANAFTGLTTVLGSGSATNFAPLILAKPAGTAAISGNLSIGSTGSAAVYWAASDQIVDNAVVDFQGIPGSKASLQLLSFDETLAGLNDLGGVGVVEVEEQQIINSNSTLTLSGGGDYTFNGTLRNRAGGSGTGVLNLVMAGTGSQTLSGPNISYTGSTTIQSGTLALMDTPNFASSITVGNGTTTLQVSGNSSLMGLMTTGGALNSNAVVQNTAGASAVLTINQVNDAVFGGVLRDHPNQAVSGTLSIVKSGNGVLALTNANTFSGTVMLSGGVLAVGSNTALGSGMVIFNNANSVIRSSDTNARTLTNALTLSTNSTFGSSTTGNLQFTGDVEFGSSNKSITIQNQETTFSGVISSTGPGSLTKLGPGSLVLSAPNTYTGPTIISAGRLVVDGSLTSNVDVKAEGLLAGSGMIVGNVTGTGSIAPGNSIGTLSIIGNYHLAGTHILEVSKSPNSLLSNDQILILGNGNLQYDGKLQILLSPAELMALTVGDQWDLYESTGAVSGAFTNDHVFGTPGDGTDMPMLHDNLVWQFDYQAGVLSVSVVPEPHITVILAVSGLYVLARCRRRVMSGGYKSRQ